MTANKMPEMPEAPTADAVLGPLYSRHDMKDYGRACYLAGLAAAKEGSEQALEHIASVGWPVGPDGKYSRDGEWIFMDALPKEVDAAEIKAAHTILRATLANLTALEQEAKK